MKLYLNLWIHAVLKNEKCESITVKYTIKIVLIIDFFNKESFAVGFKLIFEVEKQLFDGFLDILVKDIKKTISRTVSRSENPWGGGASNNGVGIIYPLG